MPAVLRRTLVILLVLRVIAAPVSLPRSVPSLSRHLSFVVRMRCWPFLRLQRISASSKLLQLCTGHHRQADMESGRSRAFWPLRARSGTRLTEPAPRIPGEPATSRLAVCLRC